MRTLDVWYAHIAEDEIMSRRSEQRPPSACAGQGQGEQARRARSGEGGQEREALAKNAEKARSRDSLQASRSSPSASTAATASPAQPPVIVPLRELHATYGVSPTSRGRSSIDQFRAYRSTLQHDRVSCSSGSRSSTGPARSSASAASARGRSSRCCRAATTRTRCSSRSRRPPRRSSRTAAARAGSGRPASGWCRASG